MKTKVLVILGIRRNLLPRVTGINRTKHTAIRSCKYAIIIRWMNQDVTYRQIGHTVVDKIPRQAAVDRFHHPHPGTI